MVNSLLPILQNKCQMCPSVHLSWEKVLEMDVGRRMRIHWNNYIKPHEIITTD